MEKFIVIIRRIICYAKLTYLLIGLKNQKLNVCDARRWKRAFFFFLCNIKEQNYDYVNRWNIVEGFAKSNIEIIKKIQKAKNSEKKYAPVLISVILNERERIEVFLKHYRDIGIQKFAFLDNGSTDGTVEFLKQQADVELFQTKDKFESRIKMGWINRLIAYYGTENWYLVVDADEFIVWQGVERYDIQSIVKCLHKRGVHRARALMVDMYMKGSEQDPSKTFEEIYPKCRYFDSDTYYHKKVEEVYLLCGGPRKRKLDIEVWLTKYPLFKLKGGEILSNPHTIYPYKNKWTPCFFALLHYKFLTRNDQIKMRKYADKGNYVGGSAEYKLYLKKQKENNGNMDFYYDDAVEYQSSQSLSNIRKIDKIPIRHIKGE